MSTTIAAPQTGFSAPPTQPRMTRMDFVRRYAGDRVEYIDGQVVEIPVPQYPHGKVSIRMAVIMASHVDAHDLGHMTINDTFVKASTPSDPNRLRGADFYFISYSRLPKGESPEGDPWINPELVIEIKSPSDYWPMIREKAGEYLANDVLTVVVLDPAKETATVFTHEGERKLAATDTLELPDILPGFSVPVAKFFV